MAPHRTVDVDNEMLALRRTPDGFAAAVQALLIGLESPRAFSVTECRRLLVMLGMVGSSLERHSQETGARPGVALRGLRAGSLSFRRYLAALASRVGSPPRDSFMSYVLWNMPAAAVYLPGEREAALVVPGVFGVLMRVTAERPDGRVMDTLLAQTRRLADDGRWCEY